MDTSEETQVLLYCVEDIETNGLQATGTFYGVPRQGWIMKGRDFVDYAGFAQLVLPLSEGSAVTRKIWHRSSASATDLLWHQRREASATTA